MEVTKELILKVAKSSRLSLNDEEVKKFIPEFKEILNSFTKLNKVNTDNVKPSFHPIEIKNVIRDDIPKSSVPVDLILKNTKHKKDDYFVGPKAL